MSSFSTHCRAALAALAFAFLLASIARAEEFQLENGLEVILLPIAGAQHSAVVTLFSIGNSHDPKGASGLAHLIEHLYVTAATDRAPARTVDELVRQHPAGWNAQTGDDYTVFATVVEPANLIAEIQDHAARLGNLKIAAADLRRELPRIDAELANMYKYFSALAAPNLARELALPSAHSGRRGGVISELQSVTADVTQRRWQEFYRPRNARLVVAGDFDATDIKKTIAAAFGDLPSSSPARPPNSRSKPGVALSPAKEIPTASPGTPPLAALTFVAPQPLSPDYAPFLALHQRLIAKFPFTLGPPSADTPGVRFALLDDPAVLSLTVVPRPNESAADVEKRLRKSLSDAIAAPAQFHEGELAKQNLAFMLGTAPLPDAVLAGNVYGTAFAAARRHQLHLDGQQLAAQLEKVTPADITRVANEYFSPSHGACVVVEAASSAPHSNP